MTRKHAKEPETVRLSSNEGNNMKGARRRKPVRTKRIIRLTLIASAFYAVFAARARARLSRPQTVRWVQRGTGVVMAGAAVAVATR